MRYLKIFIVMLLMTVLSTAPAWAVSLNINGKPYQPLTAPQFQTGTTMVPLNVIDCVLGSESSVNGSSITIKKGADTLVLTIDSNAAVFNGANVTLPHAAVKDETGIMLPARFVYESFGAEVTWNQQDQVAGVNFNELRQGMTAQDILLKTNEALNAYNTYKANIIMKIAATMDDDTDFMNVSGHMTMAFQKQPLVLYMDGTTSAASDSDQYKTEPTKTEVLINEQGYYTKISDIGWVKMMDMAGLDIQNLIKQSNTNDPLASIKMMQESGAIFSFGDNQSKDGNNYWVIRVTMGQSELQNYVQNVMSSMLQSSGSGEDTLSELFKSIKMDMVYDMWVDQQSYLSPIVKLDANIGMNLAEDFNILLHEKMDYEIFALGEPISVPDVSQAQDMSELLQSESSSEETSEETPPLVESAESH